MNRENQRRQGGCPLPTFSFDDLIYPTWFVASDSRTVCPVLECRDIQTPASSLLLAASLWRHCISFRWNSREAYLPMCRNWHRKSDSHYVCIWKAGSPLKGGFQPPCRWASPERREVLINRREGFFIIFENEKLTIKYNKSNYSADAPM